MTRSWITTTSPSNRPVLALDPSIVKTGWAYYDAAGVLAGSGVLRPKGGSLPARLVDLQVRALALLGTVALAPDTVVLLESPPPIAYHARSRRGKALNTRAQHVLCMAVGALAAVLAGASREVLLVDVLLWKGRRKKIVDQLAATVRLRRYTTTDEADAIALGAWWVRDPLVARESLAAARRPRGPARAQVHRLPVGARLGRRRR